MLRELWGTFSVRDHLEERPFVADVMLFDRLVLPVPPDNAEWERWEDPRQGWNPSRQKRFLDVLRAGKETEKHKELVITVPWDASRRNTFRDTFTQATAAGFEVDGYRWTAGQLMRDEDVKRLAAEEAVKPRVVAAYVSREALEEEVVVEEITADEAADEAAGEQRLAIAVGRSFLVPDIEGEPSEERDLELLERAVRLTRKDSFRSKRSSYNDFVERAVRERLTSKEAVAMMDKLLRAYEAEVRRSGIGTRVEQGLLVAATGLTIGGHFFLPLWIGSVMVAPVRYLVGRKYQARPASASDPAAMFHEARRELGITPGKRTADRGAS